MTNGWGDEYIKLSSQFDSIYENIHKEVIHDDIKHEDKKSRGLVDEIKSWFFK